MFPYLSGKKGLKVVYSNSAIPQPSHKASSWGFEELNPSLLCWRNGNLVQVHIIDSGSCQIVTTTGNRATEGEGHWQKDLMPLTASMEDWIHKLLHSRLGVHSGAPEESTGQIPRQSRGVPTVNKARSRRTGPEASEKCVCLSVSSLQQAIWESTWIHFSKYKECHVVHLHVNAILCTEAVSSSGRSGVLAGWKSKLDVWETVQSSRNFQKLKAICRKGWQIRTDDFYKRKSIAAHPINPSFLLQKHHIWILFLLKTLVFFFFARS